MPKVLSVSSFFCGAVLLYIIYSLWNIGQIFIAPKCTNSRTCFKSFLFDQPSLDLCIFTASDSNVKSSSTRLLEIVHNFEYMKPWERKLLLTIPEMVRKNGTFHLHMYVVPAMSDSNRKCNNIDENADAVYFRIPLTKLHIPDSYIFNLLSENEATAAPRELSENNEKLKSIKPVTHLKSKVTFNLLTDPMFLPREKIPIELYHLFRLSKQKTFLPILIYNFLETKIEDLRLIKNTQEEILLKYEPTYFGKLRFVLITKDTMGHLRKIGFTSREIDDIKNIFAGANFYLLAVTIVVTFVHVLFDILAFKNDINFWRNKSTIEGLSFRTVLWRAFSHAVVCLYILDEQASLLVLVPSIISTIIEFWKVLKVLRRRYSKKSLKSEIETNKYDAECMRYLSFLLYPLCIGGAVYSLFYQPHKSWYSWCIHSLVNGVYAFGFLFMLPQLFINYRLKSVEALPWKAFMYKAFTTFIDDVFAFIITMPTAHRVACFRDDVIFLVYLYQRWLYPVDKKRIDDAATFMEERKDQDIGKKID